MAPSLTPSQDEIVLKVMRATGAFSTLGCIFVVLTFTLSSRFRRPVNRLIFYATWGNLALAIMGFLSLDPMYAPYGPGTPLCTTQGFLIQMFLPSDALWNLSMAINVYLTVFRRWDPNRLKRLEPLYCAINFGAPFIIAFVLVFINEVGGRGRVYGPAAIWCWISSEWDPLRIALLYAPSWACIVVIFTIYIAAGVFIFRSRHALQKAHYAVPQTQRRSSFVHIDQNPSKLFATKTTQIQVSSEPSSDHELNTISSTTTRGQSDSPPLLVQTPKSGQYAHSRPEVIESATTPGMPHRSYKAYTVTINGGSQNQDSSRHDSLEDLDPNSLRRPITPALHSDQLGAPATRANNYTPRAAPSSSRPRRNQTGVAWEYTRVALLYFVSLLVTWVPSSINRVYSLVHEGEINFALSVAAATVLPFLGFWNGIIYLVTSWGAVRESAQDFKAWWTTLRTRAPRKTRLPSF